MKHWRFLSGLFAECSLNYEDLNRRQCRLLKIHWKNWKKRKNTNPHTKPLKIVSGRETIKCFTHIFDVTCIAFIQPLLYKWVSAGPPSSQKNLLCLTMFLFCEDRVVNLNLLHCWWMCIIHLHAHSAALWIFIEIIWDGEKEITCNQLVEMVVHGDCHAFYAKSFFFVFLAISHILASSMCARM